MKNIQSIKSKIIPYGLHIGELCIWVDFQYDSCKVPVCLSSGVTTYYDHIDSEEFLKIFEMCENETIVFNGGEVEFLSKVLPTLSEKNYIFLLCEKTEYYKDILKYVNCVELNVYGKCKEDFEKQLLKNTEFYVNIHVDFDYEVENLIEYCEKIQSFDESINLVLRPFSCKGKALPSEETMLSLCMYGNEYVYTRVI